MSRPGGPEKRFAVDIMLGKLAKWLRVLGFDARSMPLNKSLVYSLLSRGFIPVTRTVRLSDIDGILFIHSDRHFEQLKELISLLSISVDELRPFSRCGICNAELLRMPREAAFGAVPDYIFETASDFRRCPKCKNVYWPGSHRKNMIDKLKELGIEGLRDLGI